MRKTEELSLVLMGASGGIGGACALQLARPGAKIALSSIDREGIASLAARLREKGATVLDRFVDVCDENAVKAFLDDAKNAFGELDVLVNFAGLSVSATVDQLSENNYDLVMDVNVKGMFLAIKHFVPLVDSKRGALVVNFGSMAAKRANPAAPHYSAAKSAVNLFTQGLAGQLKKKNIRFTVFNPGPTDTTFFEGRIAPENRTTFMQAQDVAEVMEFVLSRDSRLVFHDLMFESFLFYQG